MASASINTTFFPLHRPIKDFKSFIPISQTPKFFTKPISGAVKSTAKDQDIIPIKSNDIIDHKVCNLVSEIDVEGDKEVQLIGGFAGNENRLSFEGGFSSATTTTTASGGGTVVESGDFDKLIDRTINATIVLAAGTFGITKLLTIDYDYWHVSLFLIIS